jgi:hypothetical protein
LRRASNGKHTPRIHSITEDVGNLGEIAIDDCLGKITGLLFNDEVIRNTNVSR